MASRKRFFECHEHVFWVSRGAAFHDHPPPTPTTTTHHHHPHAIHYPPPPSAQSHACKVTRNRFCTPLTPSKKKLGCRLCHCLLSRAYCATRPCAARGQRCHQRYYHLALIQLDGPPSSNACPDASGRRHLFHPSALFFCLAHAPAARGQRIWCRTRGPFGILHAARGQRICCWSDGLKFFMLPEASSPWYPSPTELFSSRQGPRG